MLKAEGKVTVQLGRMPRYETCVIDFDIVEPQKEPMFGRAKPGRQRFVANALGVNGRYVAAVSSGYSYFSHSHPSRRGVFETSEGRADLLSLMEQLVKEGWEPVGRRTEDWWSEGFRRQVAE